MSPHSELVELRTMIASSFDRLRMRLNVLRMMFKQAHLKEFGTRSFVSEQTGLLPRFVPRNDGERYILSKPFRIISFYQEYYQQQKANRISA